MGGWVAVGPCFTCRQLFTFAPDLVPSVPIDPVTGCPPDINPEPGGYERAVRQPICSDCVARANDNRRASGQELIDVLPGAYALQEDWE